MKSYSVQRNSNVTSTPPLKKKGWYTAKQKQCLGDFTAIVVYHGRNMKTNQQQQKTYNTKLCFLVKVIVLKFFSFSDQSPWNGSLLETACTSVPCCFGIVGGWEGWHSVWVKVAAGGLSCSCRSRAVVGGPKKEGCVMGSPGGCCKLCCEGAAGRSWVRLQQRTRFPMSNDMTIDPSAPPLLGEMGEVLCKHGSLVAVVVDPCSHFCHTGS